MMSRAFLGLAVFALVGTSSLAQQNQSAIERILLEPTVWGSDFFTVLPLLRAARESGETSLYVFADRAAGATAFETEQAAQPALTRMRGNMARPSPLRQPFLARGQAAAAAPGTVRATATTFIDGDGFHVTLSRAPALQLLPPGLTIQTVQARLGAPERVTHQTIQNRGERRPVILTLHVYAGGAIAFAESNMEDPGKVERVVLNLTSIVPVVAQ
jgi:hypothetical protein